MDFVEICALQQVQPGTQRAVRIGTTDIAVFNVAGALHAVENSCMHAGAALSGGRLCGKVVACPAHGWRYDVTTGALLAAPEKRLRKFPVEVIDGRIMIRLAK